MSGSSAAGSLRPPAWISGLCFAGAAASFFVGWVLAIIAAPELLDFFYQPRPLAVTHTFTLGWVSLMMMGVLYQYVPSLTKRPLAMPRLAPLQVATFTIGVFGLVPHFWLGTTTAMTWTAAMIAASVLLFAVQIGAPVLRAADRDATVGGLRWFCAAPLAAAAGFAAALVRRLRGSARRHTPGATARGVERPGASAAAPPAGESS